MWLSARSEQKLSFSSVSTGVLKPAVNVGRLATAQLYFSPHGCVTQSSSQQFTSYTVISQQVELLDMRCNVDSYPNMTHCEVLTTVC